MFHASSYFFICWICSSIWLIFCLCLDVFCFLSEKDSKQKRINIKKFV